MSATTDSFSEIRFDFRERPGIPNLLNILALVEDRPIEEVVREWEGKERYGDLKKQVAEAVSRLISDFQGRLGEVADAEIEQLFAEGEKYANEVATRKLLEVQRAVGLR